MPKAPGTLSWKYRFRRAKVGTPPRSCSVVWNPPQEEGGRRDTAPASFFHSFKLSFKKLTQNIALTYRVLSKMLQGQVSKDSLMGPVRLAGMVTKVAKSGFFPWLLFLGFVSLQLAIFNFLPIPALDGGHALFFLIELVIKKPLHLKTQEKINRIGFTLLIGLFIFVVFNDITQLFRK